MQRAAFAQRHACQVALGGFRRLADRFRHFARLAVPEADPALLVADDDERGETEAPSALHHLRDAVDVNELVGEFVTLFSVAPLPWRIVAMDVSSCLISFLLKPQSAFTGGIGERLDAPVIPVAAAVEDTSVDALFLARSATILPTALAASMSAPVLPRRADPFPPTRPSQVSPFCRRSPARRYASTTGEPETVRGRWPPP